MLSVYMASVAWLPVSVQTKQPEAHLSPSKIFRGTITQCRLNRNRTGWPCTIYKYSGTIRRNLSAAACMNYTSPATARIMTA